MKFVEQAMHQAGTLLGAVWELGGEHREPERFEEASRVFQDARTASQAKNYEEAWILASQASLKAIDLKEALSKPIVEPAPAIPPRVAYVPAPAEPPAAPRVHTPSTPAPKAQVVRVAAPSAEPKPTPQPVPTPEPLLGPDQERRFDAGKRQYEQRQYSSAIGTWESVLRDVPGHPVTRISLSRAYRYLGLESFRARDYRQAARFWRQGLQHAPEDAEMKTFVENAESIIRRLESINAASR